MSKRFVTLVYFLAIGFFLLTAVKSTGYYHEDEYYQTIGFAEYRFGNTNEVSWEYSAKIRSSIQPLICSAIFSFLRHFNIGDPFTLSLVLRLITAVVALSIITVFAYSCLPQLKRDYWEIFFLMSYFLWFIPFLSVRFSSETWSGLFSLLAFAINNNNKYGEKKQFFLLGVILGISCLFRFQSLAIVFGLFLWLFIIEKLILKDIENILIGLFSVFLFGVFVDSCFYGEFTVTLYNYINVNLLQDVSSFYGTAPWYEMLIYVFTSPTFPIGLLLICSAIVLFNKGLISPYIWYVIPFIVAHSLIAHKELRFIFPLAYLAPIFIAYAIQSLGIYNKRNLLSIICLMGFVLINAAGLFVIVNKSSDNGSGEIANHLYHAYPGRKVNLITSFDGHPFDPTMKFKTSFYKSSLTNITDITSIWDDNFDKYIKQSCVNVLVLPKRELIGTKSQRRLHSLRFNLVFDTQSSTINEFLGFYDDDLVDNHLLLYVYKNPDPNHKK